MGNGMTTGQDIPTRGEQHPASRRRDNTVGRVSRTRAEECAYTIRLCVSASVGTVLTVVFLAWLWGTIAPQPPGLLERLAHEPGAAAEQAIEGQAQRLSSE